jgi:NTP pyrophosphatase (non-canonical NTP hydrolase)
MIDRLMSKQRYLMDRLGIKLHQVKDIDVYHDHFIAGCIGLASEALEVLDEVNIATRPWVDKKVEEVQSAVAREAIDVLFYLLEIFIFLKITPEQIEELFNEKWKINIERIEKRSKSL